MKAMGTSVPKPGSIVLRAHTQKIEAEMTSRIAKLIGRRLSDGWGKPHLQRRKKANQSTRAVLKRLLKGGRSQLAVED